MAKLIPFSNLGIVETVQLCYTKTHHIPVVSLPRPVTGKFLKNRSKGSRSELSEQLKGYLSSEVSGSRLKLRQLGEIDNAF